MATTSFLSIPPEGRTMIYELALKYQVLQRVHKAPCMFSSTCVHMDLLPVSGLLSIRASNAQIAHETRTFFFSQYTVRVDANSPPIKWCIVKHPPSTTVGGKKKPHTTQHLNIQAYVQSVRFGIDNDTIKNEKALTSRIKLLDTYSNLQEVSIQLGEDHCTESYFSDQQQRYNSLRALVTALKLQAEKLPGKIRLKGEITCSEPRFDEDRDCFGIDSRLEDLDTSLEKIGQGGGNSWLNSKTPKIVNLYSDRCNIYRGTYYLDIEGRDIDPRFS